MIYAALNAMAERACLVVSADEEKHLLSVANGTYADRKCGLRNLGNITAEETGVYDNGVLGKSADTCSRGKRSKGLVEGDVSVNAATTEEEVDAAVGSNLILVAIPLIVVPPAS